MKKTESIRIVTKDKQKMVLVSDQYIRYNRDKRQFEVIAHEKAKYFHIDARKKWSKINFNDWIYKDDGLTLEESRSWHQRFLAELSKIV